RSGGTLCDDDRCQVYLGAAVEYPEMDEAVAATDGEVLTYGGALASTVYSASGGGVTATPQEGFGTDGTDFPYLRAAPYEVADPPVWTAAVAVADLGRRLGYPGEVQGATVSAAGPSGRVLEVVLDGDAGPRAIDGLHFASRLGLDSTLFSIRTAVGTPSPVPAGEVSIQAPPDAAASLPPFIRTVAAAGEHAHPSPSGPVGRSVLLLAAAACLLLHSHRRRRARQRG
ncbi:MAG TPA: SpoIID/LytB domain-containing protein, partial [Acidimicrobiales bacterium]